jgi:hypothetical protein
MWEGGSTRYILDRAPFATRHARLRRPTHATRQRLGARFRPRLWNTGTHRMSSIRVPRKELAAIPGNFEPRYETKCAINWSDKAIKLICSLPISAFNCSLKQECFYIKRTNIIDYIHWMKHTQRKSGDKVIHQWKGNWINHIRSWALKQQQQKYST